ncbi:MAG: NYN domain-containing protein [Dehalococcoidia bacterium]|nr:NYN domain-containing protein [Dehalococcoidia bacterium]
MNIFPRRKDLPAQVDPDPEREAPPEPSPAVMAELDEAGEEGRRRTRRGSRGGRGRRRTTDGVDGVEAAEGSEAVAEANGVVEAGDAPIAEAPARAPRRRTPRAATVTEVSEAAAPAEGEPAAEEPKPRRTRARGKPETAVTEVQAELPAPEPARPARTSRAASTPASTAAAPGGDTASILRAMERQSAQIEQLLRLQEDNARRGGGASGGTMAPPQRVGIFVDAANIELACDRLRARFDWGKVLRMLTRDRQLIRAVAYSPVHDDPGVSMETQRFAEPFLGRGFKVVTKALKRFSDGSVKANVDIELALDVVAMLDRLDVVCLVSGDGDFQPLVEFVQSRGVRCEVVAVAQSAAMNLKNAADEYIDLAQAQRLKEIRV